MKALLLLALLAACTRDGYGIESRSVYRPVFACVKMLRWANDQVVRICDTLDECNKWCDEQRAISEGRGK